MQTKVIVDSEALIHGLFPKEDLFCQYTGDDHDHQLSPDHFIDIIPKCLDHLSQESEVAAYMTSVSKAADAYAASALCHLVNYKGRVWISRTNEVALLGGDVHQRPDIVCVDSETRISQMDWRLVRTTMDIRSDCQTPDSLYELCTERATCIFRCQDTRRFVLTMVLHHEQLTLALFDRGGSIATHPFSIIERPELFVHLVLGFSCGGMREIGFDLNFSRERRLSTSLGSISIILTLSISEGLIGQGTVVQSGTLQDASPLSRTLQLNVGDNIIVKTIWADPTRPFTEGTLLSLLAAKGVRGVPRLIAEEHVRSAHDQAIGESTFHLRSRLLNFPTCFGVSGDTGPPGGYESRSLMRMYSTPLATPVTRFESLYELLQVFYDCITTHMEAASDSRVGTLDPFEFRIIHRDPSLWNIGMVPQSLSTFPDSLPIHCRRGLLLDWGYAGLEIVNPEDEISSANYYSNVNADVDMALPTDVPDLPRCNHPLPVMSSGPMLPPSSIGEGRTSEVDWKNWIGKLKLRLHGNPADLEVSGTRAFMSIEILKSVIAGRQLIHQPHHDLESFFQVLVAICVWFVEPHKPRPISTQIDALADPDTTLSPWVTEWLFDRSFIDTDDVAWKSSIFCSRQSFNMHVISHLSPYFESLGPMLEQLRNAIYGTDDYPPETITHRRFLDILREQLDKIKDDPELVKSRKPQDDIREQYPPISETGEWMGGTVDTERPALVTNFPKFPGHRERLEDEEVRLFMPSSYDTPSALSSRALHVYLQVPLWSLPEKPQRSRLVYKPFPKSKRLRSVEDYRG